MTESIASTEWRRVSQCISLKRFSRRAGERTSAKEVVALQNAWSSDLTDHKQDVVDPCCTKIRIRR
jgi:hypothetical protein